ncbi:MAG: hypothetical protein U1E59_00370 [Amaricoccus sp.]
MGTGDDDFEATVRRAFERLTCQDLPAAAAARGWPVRTPPEFQRLLLDHLRDSPHAPPPPGTHPCLFDMVLAVELGERLLAGKNCCTKMSRRQGCGDANLEALRRLLAAPLATDRPH